MRRKRDGFASPGRKEDVQAKAKHLRFALKLAFQVEVEEPNPLEYGYAKLDPDLPMFCMNIVRK